MDKTKTTKKIKSNKPQIYKPITPPPLNLVSFTFRPLQTKK